MYGLSPMKCLDQAKSEVSASQGLGLSNERTELFE